MRAKWRPSSKPTILLVEWLVHVDPGTHRRIKGLRLVTAYGIAAMLGAALELARSGAM